MSKHASGPWTIDTVDAIKIKDSAGNSLAMMMFLHHHGRRDTSEVEANAKLIAAAPEMLDALSTLEVAANTADYCYSKRPENFAVALKTLRDEAEKARAAIAKATGEA